MKCRLCFVQGEAIETSVPSASVFYNHSLYIPTMGEGQLGVYQCRVWAADMADTSLLSRDISVVEACKLALLFIISNSFLKSQDKGIKFLPVTCLSFCQRRYVFSFADLSVY